MKGNEEADKTAIDIPGVTTTKLPYTVYYLTIKRARNSKRQRSLAVPCTGLCPKFTNQSVQMAKGV